MATTTDSSVPVTNFKPHVRLEYTVSDPPTLICCCTIWVEANKKLTATYEDTLKYINVVRYAKSTGPVNIAHWEHFQITWNWPDYDTEKWVINIVESDKIIKYSSDRAEPAS